MLSVLWLGFVKIIPPLSPCASIHENDILMGGFPILQALKQCNILGEVWPCRADVFVQSMVEPEFKSEIFDRVPDACDTTLTAHAFWHKYLVQDETVEYTSHG